VIPVLASRAANAPLTRTDHELLEWPWPFASLSGFIMSKRHESNAARKGPKQQRSKVTVSAILDATVRVLEQEGSDAATTSRIAEVAGVSVGTLYQYFANRDAILDALQDREFCRTASSIARAR
jgi:AcrR family transcriptional regulator